MSCELHPGESGEYCHPLHSFVSTAFTMGDSRELNLRFSEWPFMKGNSPVTWPSFPLRLLAKPGFSQWRQLLLGTQASPWLTHWWPGCRVTGTLPQPFPPAGCAQGQGGVESTFVSAAVSQRLSECRKV